MSSDKCSKISGAEILHGLIITCLFRYEKLSDNLNSI